MDNTMQMKTCNKCGKTQDILEFWNRPVSPDGHYHICRTCMNKYKKKYKASNPSEHVILYLRIEKNKQKHAEKTYKRNYATEENHTKYKEDQRNRIKNWLQLPENSAAHYARTSVVAVMDYLRKRRSVKMHNQDRISIAATILYHARNLQLPLDQIQVDHIIPLVHLSRFLILEKSVNKKTAVKIMNSQPNLRLIEKSDNRHKYDLIKTESLTAAIHLEDAYECCKGLGDYLREIMRLQKEWGASICKIRKNPEENIKKLNNYKSLKEQRNATKN